MRKILIMIVIALLLVIGYFMAFEGLNVFGMDIISISQIQDKSMQLDKDLQKLSTLTSIDQPKAMSDLNDSGKQLLITKEEYRDKVLYSSSENILAASQFRPYETEYLQTRLGNHAKDNAINLRYELRQSTSSVASVYDIYFTVTGSYVSISEFVASLENDSSLNFKIENFKIIPNDGKTENIQASFVVRDIGVILNNSTTTTSSSESTSTTQSSATNDNSSNTKNSTQETTADSNNSSDTSTSTGSASNS